MWEILLIHWLIFLAHDIPHLNIVYYVIGVAEAANWGTSQTQQLLRSAVLAKENYRDICCDQRFKG